MSKLENHVNVTRKENSRYIIRTSSCSYSRKSVFELIFLNYAMEFIINHDLQLRGLKSFCSAITFPRYHSTFWEMVTDKFTLFYYTDVLQKETRTVLDISVYKFTKSEIFISTIVLTQLFNKEKVWKASDFNDTI